MIHSSRRVFFWTPWSLLVAGILLMICLGALGSETRIGYAVSVLMLAFFVRSLLPWGVLTASKLKVKRWGCLWSRTIRLVDICSASAEIIDVKFMLVWAPILQVSNDGQPVVLRALSGYGSAANGRPNRRVAKIVARIEETAAVARLGSESGRPR